MASWSVDIPVCGYASIDVEADSEKEAIEKAFLQGVGFDDFVEWDQFRVICEGNVFRGARNTVRAKKHKED